MRKIAGLLVILMLFTVGGCSNDKTKSTASLSRKNLKKMIDVLTDNDEASPGPAGGEGTFTGKGLDMRRRPGALDQLKNSNLKGIMPFGNRIRSGNPPAEPFKVKLPPAQNSRIMEKYKKGINAGKPFSQNAEK
ncbi:MAG: hypothetical protein JXJ19_09315 [Elusimicrobia bacterium]|nr:hypothetical protein [Elusimicrobiota bacterium]